jgi:hypothetical protein
MKKTLKLLLGGLNKHNMSTISSSNILHLSKPNIENKPTLSSKKLPKSKSKRKIMTTELKPIKIEQLPLSDTDEEYIKKMQDNLEKFKKEYNKQFEDTQALYKRIGYDEEQILNTMYLKDLF